MASASGGGLSAEEFLQVQEQLIQLKNRNYELQEELRRKSSELSGLQATSPKNEALQFASKLIHRGKDKERLEGDLEGMRRKLIVQEDEFRLQQNTLISELNKVVAQCEEQERELETLRSYQSAVQTPSDLPHPLATASEAMSMRRIEELEREVEVLKEQLRTASTPSSESSCQTDIESIAKLEGQMESLKEELKKQTELASRVPELEFALEQMRSENANLSELKEKVAVLENANLKLTGENKKLLEDLENANKKRDDLQADLLAESERLIDKDALLSALEKQVIEYKNQLTDLSASRDSAEAELCSLRTKVEEKDLKIQTVLGDFDTLKGQLDEATQKLSSSQVEVERLQTELKSKMEHIAILKQKQDSIMSEEPLLKDRIEELTKQIEAGEKKYAELETTCAAHVRQIDFLVRKTKELEDFIKRLEEEKAEIIKQRKIDGDSVEESRARDRVKHEEELMKMKAEMQRLMECHDFDLAAKEDLYQEKLKLELSDFEKQFTSQKLELEREVESLKDALLGKDAEKALALKKQSALVKELKRSLAEERKRSEGMERAQTTLTTTQGGWTVVTDPEVRSNHTTDGNESVSSLSVLESDNVELINRLTRIQREHAETIDRMNALETENCRLRREVEEKSELIEHWIRGRPVASGGQQHETRRVDGVGANLRKFISSTMADESAQDIREMNRKLQRMLEETLSKNITLQRDLQTLLERTEM